MTFQVSVVIPVYNAAKYLTEAVESVLEQPETNEIILVEDASLDNSLEVGHNLEKKYEKVHLFQHPGGVNRGAGPSRNLGIEKSQSPFIAFLDADDYYLPGRFKRASEFFTTNPDCDGVYEAVGIHFEDEAGRERWMNSDMAGVRLTMLNRIIKPEELFGVLIKGGAGHIHLDGLVIKRSILDKTGVMNDKIADTLHEDTDFILRLAAVGKNLPGKIDQPVAVRRVHAENRVSAQRPARDIYQDHFRQRRETYRWCKAEHLKRHTKLVFLRMLGDYLNDKSIPGMTQKLPKRFATLMKLVIWPFKVPEFACDGSYWIEVMRSIWAVIRLPFDTRQR